MGLENRKKNFLLVYSIVLLILKDFFLNIACGKSVCNTKICICKKHGLKCTVTE